MRFASLLCLSLCCTGCAFSYVGVGGYRFDFKGETAKRTESGAIEAVEIVEVDNQFGAVRIEPGLAGDYGWQWDLTVWSNTENEATEWLTRVKLERSETSGHAKWELVLPKEMRGLRGVQSDLTLKVPSAVEVRVENRGNVDVSKVDGQVEIRNEHGDVKLAELPGDTAINNEHGNVTAAQLGSTKLKIEHGEARVTGISGDLSVDSSHGNVQIAGVSGAVTTKGEHHDLEIREVDGAVKVDHEHGKVSLVGGAGTVDARNEHGRLEVDTNAQEVRCENEHGKTKVVLRNPEIRSFKMRGEHSDMQVVVPPTVQAIAIKSEHGDVNSDVSRVGKSAFSISAEHGDVDVVTRKQ